MYDLSTITESRMSNTKVQWFVEQLLNPALANTSTVIVCSYQVFVSNLHVYNVRVALAKIKLLTKLT